MANHHEAAAVEGFIEAAVGLEANQHAGMVGEFEMVIGDQQNMAVVLDYKVAGFSTRDARR
ncbi:hypothetical protein D3C81_1938360 [compost metagenome]